MILTTLFKGYIRVALICMVISLSGIGEAQAENGGRLIYSRRLVSGVVEYIAITQRGTFRTSVPSSECHDISPDKRFIVTSQYESPSNIKITDLLTGTVTHTFPWDSRWTNFCYVGWEDNNTILIFDRIEGEGGYADVYFYLLDITTGTVQGPQTIPFVPPVPNLIEHAYLPSPDHDHVVYIRCISGEYVYPERRENCNGSTDIVVYSKSQNRVLDVLKDNSLANSRRELEITFSWSTSGRYLSYIDLDTDNWLIYDVQAEQHIAPSPINPNNLDVNTFTGAATWSPDDSKFYFWVGGGFSESSVTGKLAIYDLINRTLTVFPTIYDRETNGDWMFDSQSIVLSLGGKRVVEVALDGTEAVLDENITGIYSWNPVIPAADAGTDQTVTSANGLAVPVTLDGSGSRNAEGIITDYIWKEGATQIATGVSPTVNLSPGIHQISLTVINDRGLSAISINPVKITVQAPTDS